MAVEASGTLAAFRRTGFCRAIPALIPFRRQSRIRRGYRCTAAFAV